MILKNRNQAMKVLKENFANSNFHSPEDVVNAWRLVVKQITEGSYNVTENEYWNDLDVRGIIDKIGLNEDIEVKKIDEKFKTTLINTNVRIWGYKKERKDDWWNFGYPNNLSGYLKDYFDSFSKLNN